MNNYTLTYLITKLLLVIINCSIVAQQSIEFQEGISPEANYTMHATYIRSDSWALNNKYDNEALLNVQNPTFQAILGYDLSGIPSGATIDSVIFTMYSQNIWYATNTWEFNIYKKNNAFDETTATFATDGDDYEVANHLTSKTVVADGTTGHLAAGTEFSFASSAEFVSAAQAALDGGVQLAFVIATGRNAIYSDDAASANLAPKLTVYYSAGGTMQYNLTTNAINGSVSLDPAGGTYVAATVVQATATPNAGYVFNVWAGDIPTGSETNNPVSLQIDSTMDITVNFIASSVTQFELTTNATNGTVSLNPAGGLYDMATVVQATATANVGYEFSGWTGDIPSGSENNNPVNLQMDSIMDITATFTELPPVTLTTNATNGTVSLDPAGGSYTIGTIIQATAMADEGYGFNGWTGNVPAGNENNNPLSLKVDSNMLVTANFTLLPPEPKVFQEGVSPDAGYTMHATHVRSDLIENNFDGQNSLNLVSPYQALLGYELSGIPSGATIDSVIFTMYNQNIWYATGTWEFNIYKKDNAFDETTATFNTDGDDYDVANLLTTETVVANGTTGHLAAGAGFIFPSTPEFASAAQAALDGGIQLAFVIATGRNAIYSDDAASADVSPKLSVYFTPPVQYSLAVNAVNGSVDLDPDGGTYIEGTVVELTASADPGYKFENWNGDISSGSAKTNPLNMQIDSNMVITANFADLPKYNVTTTAINGSIVLDPAGGNYDSTTIVQFTATADPGFRFTGWSGDVPIDSVITNSFSLQIDSAMDITANFVAEFTITTNATNGSVTLDPAGGTYDVGTLVQATATANTGYEFSGWTGNVPVGGENDNPLNIQANSDMSITATFAEIPQFTIAADATNGTVTFDPAGGLYDSATVVQVRATADEGYEFSGWTGDIPEGNENDNPLSISVDSNITFIAKFSVVSGFRSKQLNEFSIFPIPANNEYLKIEIKDIDRAVIIITDITGKVVLKENWINGKPIDIQSLNNGLYIISILSERGDFTDKFIIE